MRFGDSWPVGPGAGGPAVGLPWIDPREYEPDDSEALRIAEAFADAAAEYDAFADLVWAALAEQDGRADD